MNRLFTWLMVAFVAPVLLATLTRSIILGVTINRFHRQETINDSMQDARFIADWARGHWTESAGDLRLNLVTMARVAGARILLTDTEGTVRADTHSDPSWEGAHLNLPELDRAFRGHESVLDGPSPWMEPAVACVVPVRGSQGVIGAVLLFIPPAALPPSPTLSWNLLWTGLMSFLTVLMVAYWLSRRLSRTVEQISAYAEALGQGEFGATLQVRSFAEVNRLADTLAVVGSQLHATFTALSDERERLNGILHALREGVIAIDAAGSIMLINGAARRFVDWNPSVLPLALEGTPLPPALSEAISEAASGRETRVEFQGANGTRVLAVCSGFTMQDGKSGAIAVLQDLTEIMRSQRIRDHLVADVAHELRGPLANLQVLGETVSDATIAWETREQCAQQLKKEVKRLTRLARDVLDLSRLDAGVLALQMTRVNLREAVGEALGVFADQIAGMDLDVCVSIDPDLSVSASAERLDQVLCNLIENSLRHLSDRGALRFEARPDGDLVQLVVADTGSGIPAEHLPFIFDRFYKVDPARSRTTGGTGLGLSLVKKLIELQGGQVSVGSEEGKGTVFTLCLRPV